MNLNSLLSQTLNKYSDLKRCDRAYHEITYILSLHDDPEMQLLRNLLSKPSLRMQNIRKIEHLVQSLEKKMKSSEAVSSHCSITKFASVTPREEKNIRQILENTEKTDLVNVRPVREGGRND